MASGSTESVFIVWGIDQTAYGPVELPTLVAWVQDERVTAETWIFTSKEGRWQKAAELTELQMFFHKTGKAGQAPMVSVLGVELGDLRRMKLLGAMSDEQLERFASFVELEKAAQGAVVVRQGASDQAMYLVLDGELSVKLKVLGEESLLGTLGTGDFFGDVSLFDHGPRSADVTANRDSLLVKISSVAFQRLAKDAPDLATPLLFAISKTLSARIRAGNKHQGEAMKFARASD